MLNAVLKVMSGQQLGTLIPLPVGRFLIGREEDCQLRPNSELVSRHHCVFSNDDYTVRVRDLGSTNGTFVNGETIRGGVELKSQDRVSVGKIEFQVLIGDDAEAAANQTDGQPAEAPGTDDTGTSASFETATEIPSPNAAPVAANAPTVGVPNGDTVYQGMPGQMPGYVYPPYAQQPYPYGYPPPGYPSYYPQMPMAYPGQQQYPPPQQPGAAPLESPTDADESSIPEVKLPDPSTTGAKPPEPPQPSASGDKKAENVPEQAANIIKQYLQRRPTSD